MPSLTWKLIALLTLIFAVAVFLWFIFLGPLSRCDRLLKNYAVAVGSDIYGAPYVLREELAHHGCVDFWKEIKDD
jgi:hypothetical protein